MIGNDYLRHLDGRRYHSVTATLRTTLPAIANTLEQAEPDLTAFATFPTEHWRKIWSNNPIERLNREINRRADVVQIFPDQHAVTRLICALLSEQHEEWCYSERRYLSEISMTKLVKTLTKTEPTITNPAPTTERTTRT